VAKDPTFRKTINRLAHHRAQGAIVSFIEIAVTLLVSLFPAGQSLAHGAVLTLPSPAILGAVVVYTLALRLFGIEANFADMLGYLPVIFFGAATPGPMRSVAILLWVILFPGKSWGDGQLRFCPAQLFHFL